MSSNSRKGLVERLRRGKRARARLIESNLAETIAFQIRATRDARGMTQANLARDAGMTQNNISRMESEEYGKHSITSLKRIAEAFDVALDVRFVPYSQYIDWLSGTPHLDKGISPEALAVPGFDDENRHGVYDSEPKIYRVFHTVNVATTSNTFVPTNDGQIMMSTVHAGGVYNTGRQVA